MFHSVSQFGSYKRKMDLRVPAVAQQYWWYLGSTGLQVWFLACHSGLRTWHCCKLWCRPRLQLRFDPWPRNFHMPQVRPSPPKKKCGLLSEISRGLVICNMWDIPSKVKGSYCIWFLLPLRMKHIAQETTWEFGSNIYLIWSYYSNLFSE